MSRHADPPRIAEAVRSASDRTDAVRAEAGHELDLTGEVCPYTFVKSKLMLETLPAGEIVRVVVDHHPATDSMPLSLEIEGHEVLSVGAAGPDTWEIIVRCKKWDA